MNMIVGKLADFGDYLGAELAVIGYATGPGDFDGPLVLAEIVDSAGLKDFIELVRRYFFGSSPK